MSNDLGINELKKLISTHKTSLFIEKWTLSNYYFIFMKTPATGANKKVMIGKITEDDLLNGFELIESSSKHPNEKCTWYKFK